MSLPNFHIIGIQGSGKGTQSKKLVEHYGFTLLATGNLLRRRALQHDTEGEKIAALLRTGELLPDPIVATAIKNHLEQNPPHKGLLGDGVLRTMSQIENFSHFWNTHNLDQPTLIYLQLSDDIARSRIAERGVTDDIPREDTTVEAIETRIRLFHEQSTKVLSHYNNLDRVIEVDASKSVEEVFLAITTQIENQYPSLSQ